MLEDGECYELREKMEPVNIGSGAMAILNRVARITSLRS
jgi:hypothetical protein